MTFMKFALEQAKRSKEMREVPVGCVFAHADRLEEGEAAIAFRAHNLTNLTKNVPIHFSIRGYQPLRNTVHQTTRAIDATTGFLKTSALRHL
jgi:tRNA(Arg) A34 adenosine deaminase TadA